MPCRILSHICCGPCSILPMIRLLEYGYEPIGYFYNPNIHPLTEYLKRRKAVTECAKKLDISIVYEDKDWNIHEWLTGFNQITNKKQRCIQCISLRLERSFKYAQKINVKYVTSSLLFSRFQPHNSIKTIGYNLACKYNINFLYKDFRVDWQQGENISRKWNIYRQSYCGCIFSEYEKNQEKLLKLQNLN